MAYVEQSHKEIGELQAQIEEIVKNLRDTRAEMALDGPETIMVDLKTAQGYIVWLSGWAEKVRSTPRKDRAKAHAGRQRDKIEAMVKKKPKKS